MDPIQVLGKKDVRSDCQFNDEKLQVKFLVKKKLFEERYVRGMSKTPKRHFINRKDSPVKNHFIGLSKWSREDAVKAFDTFLWSQHQKDAIEKPVKAWFDARVKELMAGHCIDLIDEIDFVKDYDDSHGYTLKNYIEYLAKEI